MSREFSVKFPGSSPQGIVWVKGNLVVVDNKEKALYVFEPISGKVVNRFDLPLGDPAGIGWDGEYFLVADRSHKLVARVDMQGRASSLIHLSLIRPEKETPSFQVESSRVWGVAWDNKSLWISCAAGYSSSIYNLNPEKRQINKRFWAPGPNPKGLHYDIKTSSLLSLDASNREIRRLTPDGKSVAALSDLPVKAPTGITVDEDGFLWIADEQTNEIVRVRWH